MPISSIVLQSQHHYAIQRFTIGCRGQSLVHPPPWSVILSEARSREVNGFAFTETIEARGISSGQLPKGSGMNRQELRELLRNECIREDAYDLNGGHLSETYTLSEAYGRWFVYYSEHGLESGKKEFTSETDACEYLLNKLKRDPTAHAE
jgi:hypothetical protein